MQTVVRRPAARRFETVPEPRSTGRRAWLLGLLGLFGIATLYHWLQSRGHVTPAIFTDELMFAELARSVAGGDGLAVRGQEFAWPAVVPVLLQAPAWLLGSVAASYEAAKALNAALMCLAVFPAWAVSRLVVRPAYAFGVAAAAVAGGAMVYHSYLTSEAVAFPVFLLAMAVSVRALAEPSRRWDLITVLVLGLAVLTRAQFVALPIAFLLAVLLVGPVRRHAVALSILGVLALGAVARGVSGLGFYAGAGELEYSALETLRWAGWTAALLPFAAGMLVVPGALLGLGLAIFRPRARVESAFGVMTALVLVAAALQAGLIASGDAHRPIERYVFYVVPLLFASFFLYVERGAPFRRLYAGVALAVGGLALAVPFASLAVDPFSFDSPTLSAVEALGRRLELGDAAALFATAGLAAALGAAVIPLRRAAPVVAALSIALAFAVGAAAYSGDRRMTRHALDTLAPAQADWLDRRAIQSADVLVLPGGSLHFGWMLESWNRNVEKTYHLGDVPVDPLPFTEVGIGRDGSVRAVDGAPMRSRYLVVNDYASQIELVGDRIAQPVRGLSLYRPSNPVRLRSFAKGVYTDRWAQSVVEYAVWPEGSAKGSYQVRLELPAGREARVVELEAGPVSRRAELRPGVPLDIRIPVSIKPVPPLAIRIERADLIDAAGARPRLVGARITTLKFLTEPGSRNR